MSLPNYPILEQLTHENWVITLLDVFEDKEYQDNIQSNLIGINKAENLFWIAENPGFEKGNSYYGFTIYEGKIYAPPYLGMHCIIDIKTGRIIDRQPIRF